MTHEVTRNTDHTVTKYLNAASSVDAPTRATVETIKTPSVADLSTVAAATASTGTAAAFTGTPNTSLVTLFPRLSRYDHYGKPFKFRDCKWFWGHFALVWCMYNALLRHNHILE